MVDGPFFPSATRARSSAGIGLGVDDVLRWVPAGTAGCEAFVEEAKTRRCCSNVEREGWSELHCQRLPR